MMQWSKCQGLSLVVTDIHIIILSQWYATYHVTLNNCTYYMLSHFTWSLPQTTFLKGSARDGEGCTLSKTDIWSPALITFSPTIWQWWETMKRNSAFANSPPILDHWEKKWYHQSFPVTIYVISQPRGHRAAVMQISACVHLSSDQPLPFYSSGCYSDIITLQTI